MTAPRQVLPGSVILSTRRCIDGEYLLRPDLWLEQAFGYLLAVGSQRYRMRVLATTVMSNHYHSALHDTMGWAPAFLGWFHPLATKYVNHMRGRSGVMWDPNKKSSQVRCETPHDALNKVVYTLANPVQAGLVATADEWPGLITTPEQLAGAEPIVYERPKEFFSPHGSMPDYAELTLHRIPGFEHLSDAEYVDLVRNRVNRIEEHIALLRRQRRVRLPRPEALLTVDPRSTPRTQPPPRRLNPQIAAKDPSVRVNALRRLTTFKEEHAERFAAWREGDRDVVFPAGTYALYFRHRARRRPPPTDVWRPLAEAS